MVKFYLMILEGYLMISRFYLMVFEFYLMVFTSYLRIQVTFGSHQEKTAFDWKAARIAGCTVGGSCRPIHSISGLTPKGEVLSYDFGRLSYAFPFLSYVFPLLSYVFPLLSYVFHVLSYAPRLLPHRRLLPAQIPPPKKAPSQAAFHWYR